MTEVTHFWQLPQGEQAQITKQVGQEDRTNTPGQRPPQATLSNIFEAETELAVCASQLFIFIVQDRFELGGGYGLWIIALDELIIKHFESIDQVEDFLTTNTPYKRNAPVWVALPQYNTRAPETDFLKQITRLPAWKGQE